MGDSVTVLVGTTKGVFLIESRDRHDWTVRGPLCDGWPINHVVGEPETGRLWAAGGGAWHGAGVWRSEDAGATWALSKLANGQGDAWIAANPEIAAQFGMSPAPDAPFSGKVDAVWSLGFDGKTLWCGTKPAQLFASRDFGATWEKVQALSDHPTAQDWEPGAAGLTLHSIVAHPGDPQKLWVGISAAGIFATEDGGASWERRVRRSNQRPTPAVFGSPDEVGYCVHNLVRAPGAAEGDLLYQQNHDGVFRSVDGGRNWDEVTAGLPSGFGFPVAVHPRDPDRLWVFPLNGDQQGRFPIGGAAKVWSSGDGGASWVAQDQGLPGRDCFFTVLRQAMATDGWAPAGVYFGTNSGSVFASTDEGGNWVEIARHLPTVLSVETVER